MQRASNPRGQNKVTLTIWKRPEKEESKRRSQEKGNYLMIGQEKTKNSEHKPAETRREKREREQGGGECKERSAGVRRGRNGGEGTEGKMSRQAKREREARKGYEGKQAAHIKKEWREEKREWLRERSLATRRDEKEAKGK